MSVVAIGKFDALHRGHRLLVETARRLGPPVMLRFEGMAEALGWAPRLPLLAPADRLEVLADWSVQEVTLPFAQIRSLEPRQFIAVLRERVDPTALVIGEDFRGGPQRAYAAGDFAAAAKVQGLATVIMPLLEDHGVVSSSRIRGLLADGCVDLAAGLLGRPHRTAGTVIAGDGRGRSIGVPTANLTSWESVIPGPGVYAAWAWLAGRRIPAVLNIGRQPTIGADRPANVETHLIDWSGDAYGQRLALDLVIRLRAERKFPGLDALVAQIRQDIADARCALAFVPEKAPEKAPGMPL